MIKDPLCRTERIKLAVEMCLVMATGLGATLLTRFERRTTGLPKTQNPLVWPLSGILRGLPKTGSRLAHIARSLVDPNFLRSEPGIIHGSLIFASFLRNHLGRKLSSTVRVRREIVEW